MSVNPNARSRAGSGFSALLLTGAMAVAGVLGMAPAAVAVAPSLTNTQLDDVSGTGTYCDSVTVTATLRTQGASPVAISGETIVFKIDGTVVGTAVTNGSGVASTTVTDPTDCRDVDTYNNAVSATFETTATYRTSTRQGPLEITKAATTVTAVSGAGVYCEDLTLQATLTSGATALSGMTVSFEVGGTGVGDATTDASGVATLTASDPTNCRAVGTYAGVVSAAFAGSANYSASNGTGALVISAATQGGDNPGARDPWAAIDPTWAYLHDVRDGVTVTVTGGDWKNNDTVMVVVKPKTGGTWSAVLATCDVGKGNDHKGDILADCTFVFPEDASVGLYTVRVYTELGRSGRVDEYVDLTFEVKANPVTPVVVPPAVVPVTPGMNVGVPAYTGDSGPASGLPIGAFGLAGMLAAAAAAMIGRKR